MKRPLFVRSPSETMARWPRARHAWLGYAPRSARFERRRRSVAVATPPTFPRRATPAWRRWLVVVLVAWPAFVYWPAIVTRYGFRDDYSVLREAHEEPAKVVRVATMQARPIDGLLLASSFGRVRSIADLAWLRWMTALLVGVVAAVLFLQLVASKWDWWTAAAVAAIVTVLPALQIVVGWAVGWPLAVALLLSLAAFAAARRAFGRSRIRSGVQSKASADGARGPAFNLGWWLLAVILLAGSALVYQSNSMFYFSVLATGLWRRRRWRARRGLEWLARHVATVAAGELLAFGVALSLFALGFSPVSRRVAFEADWLGKLRWFADGPLQNALALIALNRDGGAPLVHRAAMLVALVIAAGWLRIWQMRGWRSGAWWPMALAVAGMGSFGANLLVADRWSVYRVLAPLAVTVVVTLAIALHALGGRWLARLTLFALLLPGAWLARRQTVELIARPQAAELRAVEAGARRIDPLRAPRVFVVTPRPTEHRVPTAFADEFGSLSTDSTWVVKEMLKLAMRERFPDLPDVARRYTYEAGHASPANRRYDVVIDLRHGHASARRSP